LNNKFQRLYIITPFESKLTKRGTRFPTLAWIFSKNGYSVEYITSNFDHSKKNHFNRQYIKKISKKLPYTLKVINILGYRRNISIFRSISHLQFVLKTYLYLNKNIKLRQIILIPSRLPELIWVCALIKKKKKIKLVLDISDIMPDAFPKEKRIRRKIFEIYCNIFQRKSLCAFDKFVYTSMNFRKWLNRYSSPNDSVFIPLGFDEKRWESMKVLKSCDFGNVINIVYIGDLTSNIDIFPIINSIKNKNNIQFTIIGGGDYISLVKKYVQNNRIKNIAFTGFVDPNEVPNYMKKQHLSVIPMRLDTIPNKLFDSIAAYLPVLVLGKNDTSRFVKQYNIGWELSFNETEISTFFNNLTKNEIIEKSNNIRKIRNEFSKDKLYKEFIKYVSE